MVYPPRRHCPPIRCPKQRVQPRLLHATDTHYHICTARRANASTATTSATAGFRLRWKAGAMRENRRDGGSPVCTLCAICTLSAEQQRQPGAAARSMPHGLYAGTSLAKVAMSPSKSRVRVSRALDLLPVSPLALSSPRVTGRRTLPTPMGMLLDANQPCAREPPFAPDALSASNKERNSNATHLPPEPADGVAYSREV